MEIADALDRISHIHAQITKGEVYRGSRPLPILLAAAAGLIAAMVEPWIVRAADPAGWLGYWVIVGVVAGAVSGSGIVANYAFREGRFARRRTRQVVGQLAPALTAAFAITVVLARDPAKISLLPGLWALTFALGVFAVRPYAPRGTGWVALFYLAAGIALLGNFWGGEAPSGWSVGGTFGVGQVAAAFVMHRDLARDHHAATDEASI